ncbi:MAG TPA: GAF domain-containing protein [Williamwhitmania sp.]|nr:GAF domain-containing protein [Williamwhitmania sp.]
MDTKKKDSRYSRIYDQLTELVKKSQDPTARMCSISAVLKHKLDYFFWCGFYCLTPEQKLIVRTYQGPVACMELKTDVGVCWAGINQGKTIMVEDVEQFPGHIACDSRSKSEIVVPVFNPEKIIVGVMDVDSSELGSFDEIDAKWLEKIVALIYS